MSEETETDTPTIDLSDGLDLTEVKMLWEMLVFEGLAVGKGGKVTFRGVSLDSVDVPVAANTGPHGGVTLPAVDALVEELRSSLPKGKALDFVKGFYTHFIVQGLTPNANFLISQNKAVPRNMIMLMMGSPNLVVPLRVPDTESERHPNGLYKGFEMVPTTGVLMFDPTRLSLTPDQYAQRVVSYLQLKVAKLLREEKQESDLPWVPTRKGN